MIVAGREFGSVWLVDSLYGLTDGENPMPVCAAVKELDSGRCQQIWLHGSGGGVTPPLITDDGVTIMFSAIPVISCFISLGWQIPSFLVDLQAEFRCLTNGLPGVDCSRAGMMRYFCAGFVNATVRTDLEKLLNNSCGFSEDEQSELQSYCRRRLSVLEQLFRYMQTYLDGERTLFRGEYLMASTRIERTGIPMDTANLFKFYEKWPETRNRLTEDWNSTYPGVFRNGRFNERGFSAWVQGQGIPWPLTSSGLHKTDDDTLKDMELLYPVLEGVRQAKKMLNHMEGGRLAIGRDGRNRCPTRPFSSVTGRNQPPNGKWLFGAPRWMRQFIHPPAGQIVVMVDYRSQEFAIGAALSGDPAMIAAYVSGDPYMAFAIECNAAPIGATAESHPATRSLYKTALISIMYGIGADTLALRLGISRVRADGLLRDFRRVYQRFYLWQQAVIDQAYIDGMISTSLGWRMAVTRHTNSRTLGNFLLQATGGDMLRLAVCRCQERRISVCAMVHDALLVECRMDDLEKCVIETGKTMEEAGITLLNGFIIRTDHNAEYCQT